MTRVMLMLTLGLSYRSSSYFEAAMLISFVATTGPAWWAARWKPVDGLRYD